MNSEDSFDVHATKEVSIVMDALEKEFGSCSFALYGLCSGADIAVKTALADKRVIGVIQIDGLAFETWQYYFNRYKPLILKSHAWKNLFTYHLPKWFGKKTPEPQNPNLTKPNYLRTPQTRKKVEAELEQLLKRHLYLSFIYTGSPASGVNHADQFAEMYPKLIHYPRVHTEFLAKCSHTLKEPAYQMRLLQKFTYWLESMNVLPQKLL